MHGTLILGRPDGRLRGTVYCRSWQAVEHVFSRQVSAKNSTLDGRSVELPLVLLSRLGF